MDKICSNSVTGLVRSLPRRQKGQAAVPSWKLDAGFIRGTGRVGKVTIERGRNGAAVDAERRAAIRITNEPFLHFLGRCKNLLTPAE